MNNLYQIDIVSRTSAVQQGRPPLLFVHGVSHNAHCWDRYWMPWFAQQGWDCHALSLRGHGDSGGRPNLNQHTLDDYVVDVLHAVDRLDARPVLVGHSMGAGLVQMVMERKPQSLAGAILLTPPPPGWLTSAEQLRMFSSPKTMWATATLIRGGQLCTEHIRALPFFSGRIDHQTAESLRPLLQAESAAAVNQIPHLHTRPGQPDFPLMVLGSRGDALFGASTLERTASHYGIKANILDQGCHDLMLDPAWQQGAAHIAKWLHSHNSLH